MKVDLIKNEQARGMFLLAVSEDLNILSKTDIEFKVNGDETSFHNFINAINENFSILLKKKIQEEAKKYLSENEKEVIDNRVNELVNEKIDKFMHKLQEIRKDI